MREKEGQEKEEKVGSRGKFFEIFVSPHETLTKYNRERDIENLKYPLAKLLKNCFKAYDVTYIIFRLIRYLKAVECVEFQIYQLFIRRVAPSKFLPPSSFAHDRG